MLCARPGARSRSRSSATSPRALSRPTNTMRAPMPASLSAATWPMPEVPPVMTTTFPCIAALLGCLLDRQCSTRVHGLENIRIAREPVFDFLRRFAQTDAGLAVLDPPRAGVDFGTLKILIRLRPRRIHYVSCSPPTLARDLRYLTERGYRLDSIELFDFFPQTYHIECLARLSRSDLPSSS